MKKTIQNNNNKRNIIIMITVIVIIILLLVHKCVMMNKGKNDGNKIDICTEETCRPSKSGLRIDCLEEVNNPVCTIPDFKGKTEKEILEWLDKISNNLYLIYEVYDSEKENGLVIDQSIKENQTVKDLLDNNIPLKIMLANSRNTKIDCLVDIDNPACVIPDFKGKTKKDVYDWLINISNDINTNYLIKKSDVDAGTIINQSIKKGTKVKDIIDKNQVLNISLSNKEVVNCLEEENNLICYVPNFTGRTQSEVEEWLNSIANIIQVDYKNELSDLKSNTVLNQSVEPGTNIKNLIDNNIPLSIVFATSNDNTKVNCLTDTNNEKCKLPNFVGMTKEDIENWLDSISNSIPIRYETVVSNAETGIITNQSINSGTTIKNILDSNEQLVITVSKKRTFMPVDVINPIDNTNNQNDDPTNTVEPTDPTEPEEPEEPIPEEDKGKVVVKDKNVTWENDTVVDIFTNSLANTKIAPEASNTYRFTIYNNTEFDVKYDLTLIETNDSNINMKYKLRKNNTYIVSEYSSINELNLTNQLLNSDKNDVFYLEWKWISSENDTEIGASRNATYNLKIKVEAEEIGE